MREYNLFSTYLHDTLRGRTATVEHIAGDWIIPANGQSSPGSMVTLYRPRVNWSRSPGCYRSTRWS